MKTLRQLISFLAVLLLLPTAFAQVEFGLHEFPVHEFRDADDLQETCAAPAASSFWCANLDETLTRIPTKGADFFFNDAGELLAVFGKQQKGQNLGSYNLSNGQNLIPMGAVIPGGAALLDGEYVELEVVDTDWQQLDDTTYEGRFLLENEELSVERVVRVSSIAHTLEYAIRAQRLEAAESAQPLQLAFPGIARQDEPTVKIGQDDSFSLNPVTAPVEDISYIAMQTNNRNSGFAIVMRPPGTGSSNLLSLDEVTGGGETLNGNGALAGISLPRDIIAMQRELGPQEDAIAQVAAEVYTGPNELVRYTQEGYADLPGLFNPNILGRLSLGVIWVLRYIHEFVGSWGLAIIVLTLGFRALIWPLITTQTKSMLGMQQLQPKLQALQKKYKDNREKLTEETMKLYQEAGVNPAGGCLPIILQMPLFIILWRVFVNFEFSEGFLWLPDLGVPDPFYILPAAYVAVMLAQSWFSTRANPNMFRQQMLINFVFVFIMVGFPAGVLLYFVVSMLVQVFQYWLLSRNQPAPKPAKS